VSTRQQWAVVAGVVIALGTMFAVVSTQVGAELNPLRIGDRAPDFAAVSLADSVGKSIDDYKGEVVLLNIWATWCGPCRIEMPSMEKLERELGPKGLKIVAISVDVAGSEQRIRDFANELGLTFELLLDAPGVIQRDYQTTGVPETFIIDREGRVRRRIIGADDWSSPANVAFLERLLAEPAG
jgi:cytochrome c biogenesis protein CcmG/thiol:disulfide interchange protein DsbE